MTANQKAKLADRIAKLTPEKVAEVVADIEAAEAEASKTDADRLAETRALLASAEAQVTDLTARLVEAAEVAASQTKGGIEAVFDHADLKAGTSSYGNPIRRGKIVVGKFTYQVTVSRYDASKPKPTRR